MIPLSAVWAGPERDEHLGSPPLFVAKTEGSTPVPVFFARRGCGTRVDHRPDRRRQVGAAGVDGAAIPALREFPGVRLRLRRLDPRRHARHGRRLARSRRRAVPTIASQACPYSRLPDRRRGGTGLGRRMGRRDPDPRGPHRHAGRQGASVDGIDLARVGAGGRTHADGAGGAFAILRSEAGVAPLLHWRAVRAGCWMPRRAAGRGRRSGVRDRRPDRQRRGGPPCCPISSHRIEGRLSGAPTLLIIDEGWLALDDTDFAEQLREWLKTLRKKNASVVFATQSLADVPAARSPPR